MHSLHEAMAQMGPFMLIPVLFAAAGVGMAVNISWGLATGGPRALQKPGAPYLYDWLYYLLFLVAFVGWAFALLSFGNLSDSKVAPTGFLIGWGVGAIGMGALFLLRGQMMMDGAQYQAKHAAWPWRLFHMIQARQFERQPQIVRTLVASVFIVAGIGVLLFNITHLPSAFSDAAAGAGRLWTVITTP